MFRRLIGGGVSAASEKYPEAKELEDLEDAIVATGAMMDDDIGTADTNLLKSSSAYHTLGRATMSFMRAVLGAEHEQIQEAFKRLAKAESAAVEAHRRVQGDEDAFYSEIYASGAEFSLAQAETQMMTAVVAVLSESLTESIRGFYKVRRAVNTLSAIHHSEMLYLKKRHQTGSLEHAIPNGQKAARKCSASRSIASRDAPQRKGSVASGQHKENHASAPLGKTLDEDDEFVDVAEAMNGSTAHKSLPVSFRRTETHSSTYSRISNVTSKSHRSASIASSSKRSYYPSNTSVKADSEFAEYDEEFSKSAFSHPIDAFIHSGVNFQYGMLQLLLCLVPPTFSKLLAIVGYRGNRKHGLSMLWEATRFENIHGAIAGLVISAYYTALVSFSDVYHFDDPEQYPLNRLKSLLEDMRHRYPQSSLWKMEECRLHSAERQLEKAVEIYESISHTPFKQIDALQAFEKGLNQLFLHRYEDVAESFLLCVTLNDWSHAMYHYIAGAAHVELYRMYKYGVESDESKAAHHAKEAETMLQKVPADVGKKRFLARQFPFETYVARKLNKWKTRAKAWNAPLVEAVGVSPTEELNFVCSGYTRMRPEHLEESLQHLAWSDGDGRDQDKDKNRIFAASSPHWKKESLDERALLCLFRAQIYRHLGRLGEARALLQDGILKHRPADFKGGYKDAWVAPQARFEMAAICWAESGLATDRVTGLSLLPTSSSIRSQSNAPGEVVNNTVEQGNGLANGNASAGVASKIEEKNNGAVNGNVNHLVTDDAHDKDRRDAKLRECASYIEKVANWERYDLDTRFGIKVATARETLKSLGH